MWWTDEIISRIKENDPSPDLGEITFNREVQIFERGNRENGLYESWWANGNKLERYQYKNGKREGLQETFYPNGQRSTRFYCKENIMYSRESWHKNGKYKGRVEYPDGFELGKSRVIIDPAYNPSVSRVRNHFDVNGEGLDSVEEINDMDIVRDYKFACNGEQLVNGKVPIDLYLLGFGGYYGSSLLCYDGLFDSLKADLEDEIGDWSVEVSYDDVHALCDSVDEEAYIKDMNEVLMSYYIDCINETYPGLVETIEGEPIHLAHLYGFGTDELYQKALIDIAKLEELHASCIADPNFPKALEKGDYELPFHLNSIDGRELDNPDKPWDDLALLGPLEINNLLYINANLNNDLSSPYNTKFYNITECCFEHANLSDVQLQSYVDPDLMEQIASKYKNEKKKSISLAPNDKKKRSGRKI